MSTMCMHSSSQKNLTFHFSATERFVPFLCCHCVVLNTTRSLVFFVLFPLLRVWGNGNVQLHAHAQLKDGKWEDGGTKGQMVNMVASCSTIGVLRIHEGKDPIFSQRRLQSTIHSQSLSRGRHQSVTSWSAQSADEVPGYRHGCETSGFWETSKGSGDY